MSPIAKADLWVAPAAGGTPRRLTASFDEDVGAPSWTPDGSTLVFLSQQRASAALAWVTVDGGPVVLSPDLGGEAGGLAVGRRGHSRTRWRAPMRRSRCGSPTTPAPRAGR